MANKYLTPGNDDVITPNNEVRDLGVLINPDSSYSSHVSKICSKAAHRIGMILRIFQNRLPNGKGSRQNLKTFFQENSCFDFVKH